MKIKWQGFLSLNHSWSNVGQAISRHLIQKGHEVHLYSTNTYEHFPKDLKPYVREKLDDDYDMQLSYTAMKNFPLYLSHGNKNRFGVWTYEFINNTNPLPDGFAKHYKSCDLLLPPSKFAQQVFLNSGIPVSHMKVIPHGVDFAAIEQAEPYKFKTTKNTIILSVIAQVHCRKNFPGMLEMYGRAFTNKDDVCLVLKVEDRKPEQPFELSFKDIFNKFKHKFPKHAEVEIVREFIPNIFSLYKSCDIAFSATHTEAFGLTQLEAFALGKINITPRYGGYLDFLTDDNSLLIEGKDFIVPPHYLYWSKKTGTKAFMPDIDDGVAKLKYAVFNKDMLLNKYKSNIQYAKDNYNWNTITDQILGLCQ